jgi:hypothetical protein
MLADSNMSCRSPLGPRHAPVPAPTKISITGRVVSTSPLTRSSHRRSPPAGLRRHAGARPAVLLVPRLGADAEAAGALHPATGQATRRRSVKSLGATYSGIAERWKCTIFQSGPRFATRNVTRPLALRVLPSLTRVTVSRPLMRTEVSDKIITSCLLSAASRGMSSRSCSKYL